ncbi:DUF4362 domain-containing protein [Enterococcus sp. LJL90]
MKKIVWLIFGIFILAGCDSIDDNQIVDAIPPNVSSIESSSIISDADKVTAILGEEVTNEKRLSQFINNVNQNIVDKIIIESCTIEGDIIFETLIYDGAQIELIEDYSNVSSIKRPAVTRQYFNKIIFKDNKYILQNTGSEEEFLLINLAQS